MLQKNENGRQTIEIIGLVFAFALTEEEELANAVLGNYKNDSDKSD